VVQVLLVLTAELQEALVAQERCHLLPGQLMAVVEVADGVALLVQVAQAVQAVVVRVLEVVSVQRER
jgi:hypothetical protein